MISNYEGSGSTSMRALSPFDVYGRITSGILHKISFARLMKSGGRFPLSLNERDFI